MKKKYTHIFTRLLCVAAVWLLTSCCDIKAQGIEGLYVESYYTADSADYDSTAWIPLKPGTTAWRVFVDLASGWKLQAVYGSETHPLEISTTTQFFNDALSDEARAEIIDPKAISQGHAILDSWLAMGSASARHIAVPKPEDSDGSLFADIREKGPLSSRSEDAYFGLKIADGLMPGLPANVNRIGADLIPFQGRSGVSVFRVSNGALAVVEGVRGATASNYVLLGQFTTDGELTLELNLQLVRPDGVSEQYVARNAIGNEVLCEHLLWKSSVVQKQNSNNH
ncbi:MAG: hypothetical protein ACK5XQ_00060 [Flavobacteriales bacterium]